MVIVAADDEDDEVDDEDEEDEEDEEEAEVGWATRGAESRERAAARNQIALSAQPSALSSR